MDTISLPLGEHYKLSLGGRYTLAPRWTSVQKFANIKKTKKGDICFFSLADFRIFFGILHFVEESIHLISAVFIILLKLFDCAEVFFRRINNIKVISCLILKKCIVSVISQNLSF